VDLFTLPKTAGFPQLHERVPGYTPLDAPPVRFREFLKVLVGILNMLKVDENRMILKWSRCAFWEKKLKWNSDLLLL